MTEIRQVYRCNICGNIVEVLHTGAGQLVCCGQSMQLMLSNTTGASEGKHIPVVEETEKSFKVKIGSVPHPMENDHYIEWIELTVGGQIYRQHLNPNDQPEAEFYPGAKEEVFARAYCNLHGLWES